jgi:pyruvate-formate lyase-activating enzyme
VFLSTRDRIIKELNSPSSHETASNPCLGCQEVSEGLWYKERSIRLLRFAQDSYCNFKCIYCTKHTQEYDDSIRAKFEDSLDFLFFLRKRKYISDETTIVYAAGEICVHPMQGRMLEFLGDNPCWVYSNASVYNDKVARVLEKEGSRLVSSVDAGTRETFARIKGIDLFEKVSENLAMYAQKGVVQIKYIVLPGINDNEQDINGIIGLCNRASIKQLSVSRNTNDMCMLDENTINMIALLVDKSREHGINTSVQNCIFSGTDDNKRLEEKLLFA